jgi:putative protease
MSTHAKPSVLPELLAPAGTLASALAAFDAGADAVYLGLQKFNARERGANLTLEELASLLAYARPRGKRVYVTVNTLIKEGELGELTAMLAALVQVRPDALIVQDLGVVRLLREYFPELPIHGSTQMAVHNSAGINLLADRGLERIILERQVTMEELEQIMARTKLEVEVFVHGALCLSLSGKCLFSSWLGGWSGNRGKCKQPCRRRYFSQDGNGFFFSTHDLYSLDAIPALKKLGVSSLKIEGRLRGPDYVSNVVAAYRGMLDAAPEDCERALSRGRELLSRTFGRKWGPGFRRKSGFSQVVQHQQMGVSGLLCGQVSRVSKTGFEMTPSRPLRLGDRIRIQPLSGDEGPSLTITRLACNRLPVNRVARNQSCFVSCDKEIPARGRVYLVGHDQEISLDRLKAAEAAARLDLDIAVEDGGFRISLPQYPQLGDWRYSMEISPARNRALERETVAEAFQTPLIDRLQPGHVQATVAPGLFLQERDLRKARRGFWDWVQEKNLEPDAMEDTSQARLAEIAICLSQPLPMRRSQSKETVVLVGKGQRNPMPGTLTARLLDDVQPDVDEIVLPSFCPEGQVEEMRQQLDRLITAGHHRWRVTSIYGFALLADHRNLWITSGFPLPTANSLAAQEVMDLGASRVQAWLELEQDSLTALERRMGSLGEHFSYGRIPILATRARLPVNGLVRDSRGAEFRVVREGELTFVYPKNAMFLPQVVEGGRFVDLTHADPDESDTSPFNFDLDLL